MNQIYKRLEKLDYPEDAKFYPTGENGEMRCLTCDLSPSECPGVHTLAERLAKAVRMACVKDSEYYKREGWLK